MCRGLAVIMDKSGKIYSDVAGSHTGLLKMKNKKEDECLKFEIIMDDSFGEGYSVEIDSNYEKNSKQGKEAKELLPEIIKWAKENQIQLWKGLAHAQTYRRSTGNQSASLWKTKKGNQSARCWETKKGDQYADDWKTEKGNQYAISWKTKEGNQYAMCWKTKEGDQYVDDWRTEKGNQYANRWETEEGDQYARYWSCSGHRYIGYGKTGNKEVNKFIEKISKQAEKKDVYGLRWDDLVLMAMECPQKKINEILKDD